MFAVLWFPSLLWPPELGHDIHVLYMLHVFILQLVHRFLTAQLKMEFTFFFFFVFSNMGESLIIRKTNILRGSWEKNNERPYHWLCFTGDIFFCHKSFFFFSRLGLDSWWTTAVAGPWSWSWKLNAAFINYINYKCAFTAMTHACSHTWLFLVVD